MSRTALLSLSALILGLLAPVEGSAQVVNSPTYCHQVCVSENQCNEGLSCFDAGSQTWTTCDQFNFSECSGQGGCTPLWSNWEFDHEIGFYAVDDWGANTCTMYRAYVAKRVDIYNCPGSETQYACFETPYPLGSPETDLAGYCCLNWYCGGETCSEW